MASAISAEPEERAQLSTWRNIGATLSLIGYTTATAFDPDVTLNKKRVDENCAELSRRRK
ncbi:MAG: hypothetical protein MR966_13650 [Lachnospiraceae bacterium]|nr:hypothetical protein [Lachnospiraceae bacterium]